MTHYQKAPITEAFIEIQFKGREATRSELAELQANEAVSYPEKKPIFTASITFDGSQPNVAPDITRQSSAQHGWAFVAADKLQIWQVRNGGFTFSIGPVPKLAALPGRSAAFVGTVQGGA